MTRRESVVDAPGESRPIRREANEDRVAGPKARRTRGKILAAARQQFGERGYRGTTMTDVANAAGVAQGTVYLYFRDRTDLAVAMLSEGINELSRRADTSLRASEGIAGLERILANFARGYIETPDLIKLWEEVVHVDEKFADIRRRLARRFEAAVADSLRDGQQKGLVRDDVDPIDASRALCAMADRYCYVTYIFDPVPGRQPDAATVGKLLAQLWAAALGMEV